MEDLLNGLRGTCPRRTQPSPLSSRVEGGMKKGPRRVVTAPIEVGFAGSGRVGDRFVLVAITDRFVVERYFGGISRLQVGIVVRQRSDGMLEAHRVGKLGERLFLDVGFHDDVAREELFGRGCKEILL